MKLSEHIKLALFTGLVLGILIGTIDIIAKIIKLNFEWFELYQTLLTGSIILILFFVLISLFIELFSKITKIYINKRNLIIFYTTSALAFLLLFYGEIFIYSYLPTSKHFLWFYGRLNPIPSFAYAFVIFLIYVFLLTKGKEFISKIILFIKAKKIDKLVKNYVFFIILFVVFSFIIDIYLLNSTSNFVSEKNLKNYPNILLISLDTVRADHLSLYNYSLKTSPNIDKFSEKAVIFENTISPSSWTLPAHASLFTGKYPQNHNANKLHEKLNSKEVTLAEILRGIGYNTAGFVSGGYVKNKFGIGQGFINYKDRLDFFEHVLNFDRFSILNIFYMVFPDFYKLILNSDGEKISYETNEKAFEWLDKNKQQPFFLFLHYFDAHNPYNLGGEFKKQFTNKSIAYNEAKKTLSRKPGYLTEDHINYLIALYDTEIFYLDYNLKKLFDKLDELNLLDNTIVIITADHGEEFYEHKGFTHRHTLYEEVTHVPLIIRYPKEFKAQRIKKRVNTINIFPTILEILKIEIPKDIDGESLLPLIKNEDGYKMEYVFSELWGQPKVETVLKQEAILHEDWKLIEKTFKQNNISELYNLKDDPKEQSNLFGEHKEKEELLKNYLGDISEN